MREENKTKKQLVNELRELKKRILELEASKTDINCADEVLRNRKNKYKTLIENLPQKIFYKDKNSVYLSCNNNYARDLKINPDEITGKTDYDFYPTELAEKYRADDKRIMKSGSSKTLDETYTQDGKEVVVRTVKTPVRNNKGNIVGILGIFWDITEGKRSEELLEASEIKFRTLFEYAGGAIFIGDTKTGEIWDCNKHAEKLIGCKRDNIIGMHQSELHPKGEGDKYKKKFAQHIKKGHLVDYEGEVQHRDGRRIPVWISAKTMKIGSKKMIVGIFIDITERKKKEKEIEENRNFLDSIFRTTADGILVGDSEGYIMMINEAFEKMIGYSKDELIGRHPIDLAIKDKKHKERGKKIVEEMLRKDVVTGLERTWVRKNASLIDVEINLAFLKDGKGNITNSIATLRDITKRKQLEKSINKVYMCLLRFGPNADENIKKIVETAGVVLKGVCALYNKEEGSFLSTKKGWNIPRDFRKKDKKEGHICYDVIKKYGNKPFTINNLDQSLYAKTDPNITKYKIKTYIGSVIKLSDKAIGSLCVVYHENRTFSSNELNILSILAQALGIEEDRKKTLEELQHHQQKLEVSERNIKEFSRKVLSIREEEKRNLSHSLHDELGCMSIALRSNLFLLKEDITDNHLQEAMDRVNHTGDVFAQSVKQLKEISRDLRPLDLDIAGLPNAMRQYFSDMRKQTKIKIDFRENIDEQKIDDEAAIILYRVTQETINNILKHARAKKIKASLSSNGNNIILTIVDDGRGFDVERSLEKTKGLGIRGMTERVLSLGGTFIIQSAVQKGTEIRITVPTKQQRGV